jgi:glycosyltransferase involved in cell wall biosynthesis
LTAAGDDSAGARGSRVKILFIAPWGANQGGAEQMLSDLLEQLDTDRFSPYVVFLAPGPLAEELASDGHPTSVLPAGRLRNPLRVGAAVLRLRRIFQRERPDMIVSWAAKPHLYAAPAAISAGMGDRLIWWQHSIPSGHWLDRLATILPAKSIGCSSEASASAQRQLRPRRPTFVVHPGVQVDDVGERAQEAVELFPARPAGSTLIGIPGRLQPWKGQIEFLDTLAELRRRGHDVCGAIVGGEAFGRSRGYRAEIDRTIDRLGLDGAVVVTGQVPDARPYIAAMDIVLNLSRGEPFGIVIVEAMAMRKPVIALDAAGPGEIIHSGKTGMLIADRDAATVADAVEDLIADPELRRMLGQRARARVEASFTNAQMARSLETQLDRVEASIPA